MTAGSFVLMTLMRGTIFSCIVYLSRAVEDDVFLCSGSPSNPLLSAVAGEPPQRTTNACKPRTLMARLVVLLNTWAIIGNSSFLMVLKSKTGNTTGKLRRPASTTEWVGAAMAAATTGNMSDMCQLLF